jgi:valyl-tRNA synthetase
LSVLNRLFAPYLPFVAEEVWSWWQRGSVHTAAWPAVSEIDGVSRPDPDAMTATSHAVDVLGEIRRQKSIEKRPLKAQIDVARLAWRPEAIALLRRIESDLRPAAGVSRFEYVEHSSDLELSLTFAEEPA